MNTAHNADIAIAYETFGTGGGEPLLLISGTGAQMIIWPEDLCAALADRGFQVARFDNRDTGLSTHLTGTPAPGWLKTMLRPSAAPYRLDDMAEDAVAVMDALGWPAPHLVGASLGGMIAQVLAIRYPSRVRTLTSIMSTPSSRVATMPTIAAIRALAHDAGTPVTDAEQAAQAAVALKKVIGSPGYPLESRPSGTSAADPSSVPAAPKKTPPASARRSSLPVTGAARWRACGCPCLSSTASKTRSSGPRAAGRPHGPFPAHGWSPTRAWATTCLERYGQPSWRRFPLWRLKPSKRSPGRPGRQLDADWIGDAASRNHIRRFTAPDAAARMVRPPGPGA